MLSKHNIIVILCFKINGKRLEKKQINKPSKIIKIYFRIYILITDSEYNGIWSSKPVIIYANI